MKSFPHYQQHDQMDCGPTCLRMIAAFYGKHYSLERLREKSFITRLGVSMLGISEAAEKIGFRTMGVQISFQQLLEDAPLPCIVHWNQQLQNSSWVYFTFPAPGSATHTCPFAMRYTTTKCCWFQCTIQGKGASSSNC